MIPLDIARTLTILREMAQGRALDIPSGGRLKMADNMAVGYVTIGPGGVEQISELAELTLSQLNWLLSKIGPPNPNVRW